MNGLIEDLISKTGNMRRCAYAFLGAFAVYLVFSSLLPFISVFMFSFSLFLFLLISAPDSGPRFTAKAVLSSLVAVLLYQTVSFLIPTLLIQSDYAIDWLPLFLIFSLIEIIWCLLLVACLHIAYGFKEDAFSKDRRPLTIIALVCAVVFFILAGAADASSTQIAMDMSRMDLLDLMADDYQSVVLFSLLQKVLLWIASSFLLLTMKKSDVQDIQ